MKMRFGLLGLGYFGKNYLRLLQEIDGIELAAVAAKTKKSLDELSGNIPKTAKRTTNAAAILNDAAIDAVVIATPPATHAELAAKALKNGKHVLLEKPLAGNLSDAKKIMTAANKSKAAFMVGHQYIYNDYIGWLHDNISSLGKVSRVIAEHLYPGPVRSDIGCLWDAGTHQLSIIQYLLEPGKLISARGKRVCIDLFNEKGQSKNRRLKGIDDMAAVALTFESGLDAKITVTWLSPRKIRRLTIIGSEKTAIFDDVKEKDKLTIVDRKSGKTIAPKIAAREPLRNEVEQFIRCIKTGEKPLTGIESSYEITEWLDKISRSMY